MHDYLVEMLVCPACRGHLDWQVTEDVSHRIRTGQATCSACGTSYPIREEIGLFLLPDPTRDDLWEQSGSQLMDYLAENPAAGRSLMETAVEALNPADQFFRALVLEERGDFAQAGALEELARTGLYTAEYLRCMESQMEHALEYLSHEPPPLVDLASGRGYLGERVARRLGYPLVMTDFSPRVLRRNRRWLELAGLADHVSLLAFDARRTPFRNGAIKTLVTNQGLLNVREPGRLLQELRRVVSGTFLAITWFLPETDEANSAALREYGLDGLAFRRPTLARLSEAGWQIEVVSRCTGVALPTPTSEILPGAGIDGIPVAETTLEWCLLAAR